MQINALIGLRYKKKIIKYYYLIYYFVDKYKYILVKKNSLYGRTQLSRPMWKVGPNLKRKRDLSLNKWAGGRLGGRADQ